MSIEVGSIVSTSAEYLEDTLHFYVGDALNRALNAQGTVIAMKDEMCTVRWDKGRELYGDESLVHDINEMHIDYLREVPQ